MNPAGTRPPAVPPRPEPPVQRRQHPRIDVKLSAELTLGDESFTAMTRDLSLGGVGLDLDRCVPEGALLGIDLFLVVEGVEDAGTEPLRLQGRVAWCAERDEGEWTAGIRFEVISASQTQWLEKFLAYAGG